MAGDMILQWRMNGKYMDLKLFAPATGLLAAGFGPERMKKGANIIIGYFDGKNAFIEDR